MQIKALNMLDPDSDEREICFTEIRRNLFLIHFINRNEKPFVCCSDKNGHIDSSSM